ncbi:MAG TPA: MarR family transcriptional regulator, partial [Aeromicrobium sp.]|nr:MarR family transcriptional regulator [Aeromicrobium sp.]
MVGPLPAPPDLTMRQLHVLLAAARAEGVTLNHLADGLEVSMPTASGLVDRLAAKGLVTRVEDEADRRVRHVQLTEAGHDTLAQLDSAFNRLLVEMLELLADDELVTFRDNSLMMLDMIERTRANRGTRELQPTISST